MNKIECQKCYGEGIKGNPYDLCEECLDVFNQDFELQVLWESKIYLAKIKRNKMVKELAEMMLEKRMDFLPIEESIQLIKEGITIKTQLNYIAMYEEIEDGYDCEIDDLLERMEEELGIYDSNGKIAVDDYNIMLKSTEDSFERIICPAPTYIDLLIYLDSNG